AYHLSTLGSAVATSSSVYQHSRILIIQRALELGYSHHQGARVAAVTLARQIIDSAQVQAFRDAFIVGAVVTLLTTVMVFYLPSEPALGVKSEPTAGAGGDGGPPLDVLPSHLE